jgi:hypothetical protein
MTDSSREAQPDIRNAIAKSETAYDVKREIIGMNLTSDTFECKPRCPVDLVVRNAGKVDIKSLLLSELQGQICEVTQPSYRADHLRSARRLLRDALDFMHRNPLTIDA